MKERIEEFLDEIFKGYFDGIYVRESEHGDHGSAYFSTLEDTVGTDHAFAYDRTYLETDTFGTVDVRAGATRITFIPENEDFVIKLPITDVTTVALRYIARKDEVEKFLATLEERLRDDYWTGFFDLEILREFEENGVTYLEAQTTSYPIEERMAYKDLPKDLWTYDSEVAEVFKHYTTDLMELENNTRDELSEEAQAFLAKNIFVCEYGGVAVYIQKKINLGCHITEEERTSVSNYMSNTAHIAYGNEFLYVYAYRKLGSYDKVNEIMQEFFDAGVLNDMHGGNYGYDDEDCLCIVDYAGYDDEYMWEYV